MIEVVCSRAQVSTGVHSALILAFPALEYTHSKLRGMPLRGEDTFGFPIIVLIYDKILIIFSSIVNYLGD